MMTRTSPPVSASLSAMQSEIRKRRALLNSQGGSLFVEALQARYGLERSALMAWIDVGANPYPSICQMSAALYDDAPVVRGGDAGVSAAVAAANHWGAMQRVQRDVQALREVLVLGERTASGGLSFRPVYPDLFDSIRARVGRPREIAAIGCWIEAPGNGDTDWELWTYQIEDEDGAPAPLFRREMYGLTGGPVLLEELTGDAYPHRTPAGEPFVPGVLYHAALTPRILDWQAGTDLMTGAIKVVLDSTAATAAFDDGCYRIHVALDAEPVGGSTEAGRVKVAAGPGTILRFATGENSQRADFRTLEAPVDPEALQRIARTNRRDLAELAGISAQAMTRNSAEVKSAASLVVSAAERAALQRRQKPIFMPADQELLTVAGWLLGVDVDPREWRIEYPAVQLDPAEMLLRQQVVAAGLEARTMTRLDALMYLHPSLTESEARAKLAEITAEGVA